MTGRDPTNEFNEQYWENVLGNTEMTPDAVRERLRELEAGYEQILDWHDQTPQDQKIVRLAREMLGRLDETETREPE